MGNTITTSNVITTATPLDWLTEPTPAIKKSNCGKLTQVTVFTNGTISVMAFHCHRYDCMKCGTDRKAEIKDKIIKRQRYWYVLEINEANYPAIQKRIKRAGEQYCVVGGGDRLLLLTLKPVIEGSKAMVGYKLSNSIDKYLDCPYDYRKRRFRHSSGLFEPEPKNDPLTHIKRKYAVAEAKDIVIKNFENGGTW